MIKNPDPHSEQPVLVLQGGGALGAYQAGVYEALDKEGIRPQWVAGVSIGAINAAIIAGNPPERRVARLHEFWDGVSSQLLAPALPDRYGPLMREMFNQSSAALVALAGVPGFFTPRFPPAPFQPAGTPGALSYYDTAPLEKTLERLVDFDLINTADVKHKVRLSVGAVNVETGNFRYFDSTDATYTQPIGARHIMASGALPPGFAPVEIDRQFYWDGGLVSNTPLQYVIDQPTATDMLVFQVDLFSARGRMPRNLGEVAERAKAQKLKDAEKAAKKARDTQLAAEAAAEALRVQAAKVAAAEALKLEQKAARDARYAARKKKK